MSRWDSVKLGEVFDLQMGKTPSRNNIDFWKNGTSSWISIADIGQADKYIYNTKEKITELAIKESGIKKVPKNTVIMSFKLSLGKTTIVPRDMYTNEAIMAFINKHKYEIDEHYIYHLFRGRDWTVGTNKAVMGATLNKATLSNVTIPIPPLQTQKQIANTLDSTAELLAMRKQQLVELDNLIKSTFYDMFGDPVKNEKGWVLKPIGEFSTVKIGPFGSLLHAGDYIVDGFPLVNPSHIVGNRIVPDRRLTLTDTKFKELESYSMKSGDIVVGRRGEIGRCAVVEREGLLCGTGSLFIRIKDDYLPTVLQRVISSETMRLKLEHESVGVTMKNLNAGTISSLIVPMLPLALQNQFAAIVTKIEEQKALVKKAIDETQCLFDSLMSEYFD